MGRCPFLPFPLEFHGVFQSGRFIFLSKPEIRNQTHDSFPRHGKSRLGREESCVFMELVFWTIVFQRSCLCVRMKRNIVFLGLSSCRFVSHITLIHPNVSSMLLQKMGFTKLLLHPPYCLYLSLPVPQQTNTIFSPGQVKRVMPKITLQGSFCCQLKCRGQPAPLDVTYHCRTPNPSLRIICILWVVRMEK